MPNFCNSFRYQRVLCIAVDEFSFFGWGWVLGQGRSASDSFGKDLRVEGLLAEWAVLMVFAPLLDAL